MNTAIATRPRPSSPGHGRKTRKLLVALLSAILTVFIATAVTSPAIAKKGDGSAQTAGKTKAGKKAAKKKKAVKKEVTKKKVKKTKKAVTKKAGKPKAGNQAAKKKKKAAPNTAKKKTAKKKKAAKKSGKPKPLAKKAAAKKKAGAKKAKRTKTVTVKKKVTKKTVTRNNPAKKKTAAKRRNKKASAKGRNTAGRKKAVVRKNAIARKKRAARNARAAKIRRKHARDYGPRYAYPEPRRHDALAAIIDGAVRAIDRHNGGVVVGYPAPRPATQRHVKHLPNGRTRIVMVRPNGVRIVTIRARDGSIVRRTRRTPDGRVTVLIDNRPYYAVPRWRPLPAPLPPVAPYPGLVTAPDAGQATAQELEQTLTAPPPAPIERTYTLEELRADGDWLGRLNRVDVKSITFATGSAQIDDYEVSKLAELASAMLAIIAENPEEVFMVSGHTDLVGDAHSNLELSNRRAEAIADALVRFYAIPAENLVTQGYGERYPVIPTPYAERQNRRVSVQRITPLLSAPEAGTSELPSHLR